eukprot:537344_1
MATKTTDQAPLLIEQSAPIMKKNTSKKTTILLLVSFGLNVLMVIAVIIALLVTKTDNNSSANNASKQSCGTIESKHEIQRMFGAIVYQTNMKSFTNGANNDEWFDAYLQNVAVDFVYIGKVYDNNNTVIQIFDWNSRDEFLYTGNPELGIPPYSTVFSQNAQRTVLSSDSIYIRCRENDTGFAIFEVPFFVHVINKTSLLPYTEMNKLQITARYNTTQNKWLFTKMESNLWR